MKAPEVPVWALVHLTHAALQRVADEAGVDLLHIKGPAVRTSLRIGVHDSTDADVLVRPAHIDRMTSALEAREWELHTGFDEGSPFEHAANFRHPSWTYADVHRRVPGCLAEDDAVFDLLWRDRETAQIAHQPCQVVSVPAQVALQALHAARSHGHEKPESWLLCPEEERASVRDLVADLQASTAFAAGIGELAQHRDAPDYALWSFWSRPGDDRLDEWVGRIRAARGSGRRLSLIRQALHVNRTHLRLRLDREPTGADVAREQVARLRLGVVSLWRHLRRGPADARTDAETRLHLEEITPPHAVADDPQNHRTGRDGSAVADLAVAVSGSTAGLISAEQQQLDAPLSAVGVEASSAESAPSHEQTPPEHAGHDAEPLYIIAPDVAWLDATDAGRAEPLAWTARLDTAELNQLPQASWMVWMLVADGIGTLAGIRAEISALEASIDFGEEGLDGFLARLETNGLIVRTDR
ncbi:nucleotidyltransferase family protein [Microbacterium sp. SD291]|uniref:nucleotidyltransferase family protein n=1 Tax=Microbacterium sp. SD291 TaxID=2782007 RepID=UPI001A97056C|nr:nucleotidyltransferase family protein [Microbacterium sp. SD291]MBO0981005.1 nucleotidyltransferase family protein [Microbacterium sp. SD291]